MPQSSPVQHVEKPQVGEMTPCFDQTQHAVVLDMYVNRVPESNKLQCNIHRSLLLCINMHV